MLQYIILYVQNKYLLQINLNKYDYFKLVTSFVQNIKTFFFKVGLFKFERGSNIYLFFFILIDVRENCAISSMYTCVMFRRGVNKEKRNTIQINHHRPIYYSHYFYRFIFKWYFFLHIF